MFTIALSRVRVIRINVLFDKLFLPLFLLILLHGILLLLQTASPSHFERIGLTTSGTCALRYLIILVVGFL